MTLDDLKILVQDIVAEARKLSNIYTKEHDAPVNYACIFAHTENDYADLLNAASELGTIVQETSMGPIYHIAPIKTEAGELRLLKIRHPDPKRPERGDADFTLSDYQDFKATNLNKVGFSVIKREGFEMIEVVDPAFDILVYYSHPPLIEVLNVDKK